MTDPTQKHWYIAYTRSCQEKKLVDRLAAIGVESFIATQKERRQWSDRIKIVDKIILQRHIFIHTDELRRTKLFNEVFGLVSFMSEGGPFNPVIVPDKQINSFRAMLAQNDTKVDFHVGHIAPGDKVTITRGPFSGIEGEIVKVAEKKKFIVRLEGLGAAIISIKEIELEKKEEKS